MRGWGEHIRARSAKSDFQTNAAIPGNCKANEIGRHRKGRSHYRSGWQSQKHKHCRRASCLRRCNTRGPEGMEVRTSENRHRGTEEKAEIVPGAGVVHLVDGDLVVEERNDERKGQDEPVPQSKPKASCGAVRAGRILEDVRSRSTASRKAQGE